MTMGDGGFRVVHGELEGVAADLRAVVQGMGQRLAGLEAELAPLRSDWTGDAREAYAVAKADWDRVVREMQQLLDDSQRTVLMTNEEYRRADQRGAAAFDR